MNTTNLKELRELRNQEKAIKARIDEISTEATNEAVAILAEKGQEKGEFEVEGVGKFQLQRTEVFDFADYHVMAGYVKTFVELYPDKEPDEVKLTVKVVE